MAENSTVQMTTHAAESTMNEQSTSNLPSQSTVVTGI